MPWIDNPAGYVTTTELASAEFFLGEVATATVIGGVSLLALGGIAIYEGYEYFANHNNAPAGPDSPNPKHKPITPSNPPSKSVGSINFGPHYELLNTTPGRTPPLKLQHAGAIVHQTSRQDAQTQSATTALAGLKINV